MGVEWQGATSDSFFLLTSENDLYAIRHPTSGVTLNREEGGEWGSRGGGGGWRRDERIKAGAEDREKGGGGGQVDGGAEGEGKKGKLDWVGGVEEGAFLPGEWVGAKRFQQLIRQIQLKRLFLPKSIRSKVFFRKLFF